MYAVANSLLSDHTSQPSARGLRDVNFAWQRITDTIKKQLLTPSVSHTQYRRYSIVTERRLSQDIPHDVWKYHDFLDKVYQADADYYTLCVIAFTQDEINRADAVVREALIWLVGINRGNAKDARIAVMAQISARTASQCTKRITATDQWVSFPHDGREEIEDITATNQWVSIPHAGREETQKIFGRDMAQKIKISTMHSDWRAVTMQFPTNANASCFLILDIREEHVEELAASLLGIQVDWEPRECPPWFSFTLKGAFTLKASAVFPSVVCNAVNESTERGAERAGRRADCVSMTFWWDGATIKLPMSLAKGIELRRRLQGECSLKLSYDILELQDMFHRRLDGMDTRIVVARRYVNNLVPWTMEVHEKKYLAQIHDQGPLLICVTTHVFKLELAQAQSKTRSLPTLSRTRLLTRYPNGN